MNKVFENIIEQLEELINRYDSEDFAIKGVLHKAIEIVKQEAEQCNNGWIPCSKELPPQPKENPVFENKPLELYLITEKYAVYPIRAFWNGKFFYGWI